MTDAPNTYMTGCDVCGKAVPKTDVRTVPWADLTACSTDCKQRWQNAHQSFQ